MFCARVVPRSVPFSLTNMGGNRVVYVPPARTWGSPLDSLVYTVTDSFGQVSNNAFNLTIHIAQMDYSGVLEPPSPATPVNISMAGYRYTIRTP